MAFTAKDVMALREKTGAGVMDCKKALTDADGDMNKAADLLRERGIAKAEKNLICDKNLPALKINALLKLEEKFLKA